MIYLNNKHIGKICIFVCKLMRLIIFDLLQRIKKLTEEDLYICSFKNNILTRVSYGR
jgi:hypothetical protein